ncbi:unnamed protein product [Chironomus riparius]|uniref:Uncharacterized protein n=1 Tax=Chironomus riparius TaxID=315576 RepID=A0A9N9RJS6_9DIPT|nr:unnamed protein product [Chironomus riparius]
MTRAKIILLIYFILKSTDSDYTCDLDSGICSIEGQNISASDPFVITSNGSSLVTFLIFAESFMPQAPESIFTTYPDITWLSISNTSLQEISSKVFTNALKLTNLLIQYGSLSMLNNGTFVHCRKAQSIQIVNHQISFIDIMAFQGLKELQNLILSENYLTYLHPLTLSVLPKLMNFDIGYNLLTTIDSHQFIKNPLLFGLTISGNQLKTLPNDLFQSQTNLNSIYADHNQLVTAQSYGVNYVDISFNKLRNFTLSSGETTVHIENNFIRKIICSSTNLTVERFYADNNLLTSFLCIRDMENLIDLNVNNNKMLKTTKKAFLKLGNLQDLSMLNMTRFNSVPAKIFSSLKLLLYLRVDSLIRYKNLNVTLPNLFILTLSTKTWNCTYVSHVENILNSQNIVLFQNEASQLEPRCNI